MYPKIRICMKLNFNESSINSYDVISIVTFVSKKATVHSIDNLLTNLENKSI